MPTMVAGNLDGPVMAMAWRAADFICRAVRQSSISGSSSWRRVAIMSAKQRSASWTEPDRKQGFVVEVVQYVNHRFASHQHALHPGRAKLRGDGVHERDGLCRRKVYIAQVENQSVLREDEPPSYSVTGSTLAASMRPVIVTTVAR